MHRESKECFNHKLDFTVKASKFYCIINQTKTVFHILSLSELIGASISIGHFHPHPPATLSPLLPAGGCFRMSGKWAIKPKGDELSRSVLVLRKR